MKFNLHFLILFFFLQFISTNAQNHKYDLWKDSSFFRGFNVLPIATHQLKDYKDLKATGANLVQLSIDGFNYVDSPYYLNYDAINATDKMVAFCDSVGIYYTIAVRSGPGRRDVAVEGENPAIKSTIWSNHVEQIKYSQMLKEIVERYKKDSLFVGIGLMLEPNPLFDVLHINAQSLKVDLEKDSIDFKAINQLFIDEVRKADTTMPIIVQNFQYSCPEFFAITDTFSDKYIVYEFHSYRPLLYPKDTVPNSKTYPGIYPSVNDLKMIPFDKSVLRDNVFRYVDSVQKVTGRPIFLGEFGIMYEQHGGPLFLNDVYEICREKGWHFALWAFRPGSKDDAWDYEQKNPEYWDTVLNMFKRITYVDDNSNSASDGLLKVYPTLARDKITIQINTLNSISLKIFDMLSNEISDITSMFSSGNSEINYDVSLLPEGLYFLQLQSRSGISCEKFIIIK
jgi:hypothetical protein